MTFSLRQLPTTPQGPWRSTFHALLGLLWNVGLLTFFILYIVELIIPGYVSAHFNYYLVLIVALFAFFLHETTKNGSAVERNITNVPPRRFRDRMIIMCVGILGISAMMIQYYSVIRLLNRTQVLMTALFFVIIIVVVIAIMRDEEETR